MYSSKICFISQFINLPNIMEKIIAFLIVLQLFLICFTCNNNNCTPNIILSKKFYSAIKIIENHNDSTSVSDWNYALFFLETFTNIPTSADINSLNYANEEAKRKDLKLWLKWFEENKCKYNDKQIDSLFKADMPRLHKQYDKYGKRPF